MLGRKAPETLTRAAIGAALCALRLCGVAAPPTRRGGPSVALRLALRPNVRSPGRPAMYVALENVSPWPVLVYPTPDLGVVLWTEVTNGSGGAHRMRRLHAPLSQVPVLLGAFRLLRPAGQIADTLAWPTELRDITEADGPIRIRVVYDSGSAFKESYPRGNRRPRGVLPASVASKWVTARRVGAVLRIGVGSGTATAAGRHSLRPPGDSRHRADRPRMATASPAAAMSPEKGGSPRAGGTPTP